MSINCINYQCLEVYKFLTKVCGSVQHFESESNTWTSLFQPHKMSSALKKENAMLTTKCLFALNKCADKLPKKFHPQQKCQGWWFHCEAYDHIHQSK